MPYTGGGGEVIGVDSELEKNWKATCIIWLVTFAYNKFLVKNLQKFFSKIDGTKYLIIAWAFSNIESYWLTWSCRLFVSVPHFDMAHDPLPSTGRHDFNVVLDNLWSYLFVSSWQFHFAMGKVNFGKILLINPPSVLTTHSTQPSQNLNSPTL